MTHIRTRLAAAAVGAGLIVATPVAAWAGPNRPVSSTLTTSASTPTDSTHQKLDDLRTRCLAAIGVRLPALSGAESDVNGNQHVTDEHQSALDTDIDGTTARLDTLAGEIKVDTDLATLHDHCRSIFEDNRVFALVLPRARLVVGADTADDAGAKLSDIAGKLGDVIAREEAAGRDMHQAHADLDAMKAQVATAVAAADSVPGALLGLTPADWNANHDVVQPARNSLRVARTDLKVARDLAVKIRGELVTPAQGPSALQPQV